jgi:hypothetical protein
MEGQSMKTVPKFLNQFLLWIRSFTEKGQSSDSVPSSNFDFATWDDEPPLRHVDLLQDEHGN